MNKLNTVARLSAAASLLVLAACGGGGGGGGPASNITSNPSGGTTTTPPSNSGGSTTDTTGSSGGSTTTGSSGGSTTTGSSGGSTSPASFATLGSGSTDQNKFDQFVTTKTAVTPSGSPTLTAPVFATANVSAGADGTIGPKGATQPLTSNPSFPLTQTVIAITGSGIGPANNAGATLSVKSWDPSPTVNNNFHMSIPSLGVEVDFQSPSLLKGASTAVPPQAGGGFRLTTSNSSYVALGLWEVDAPGTIYTGAFFGGYQTPTASVPTTGTATYGGTHNVSAIVSSVNGSFSQASVLGDATFNANFGAGTVTGQFTNMKVFAVGTNSPGILGGAPGSDAPTAWNDVSVQGSISGNLITNGTATALGTNNGPTATVAPGATGKFNGAFYGPNANELGSAWSLMDSTHVVIGVATGKQ